MEPQPLQQVPPEARYEAVMDELLRIQKQNKRRKARKHKPWPKA